MQGSVRYERHPQLDGQALQELFVAAWGQPKPEYDLVLEHSFTWVTAMSGDELVGFVNVAWDGGVHFFLLDTTVKPEWRGKGIGRGLVREAIECCMGHGEWLHVDANAALMAGLYEPSGFTPTPAGLVRLEFAHSQVSEEDRGSRE